MLVEPVGHVQDTPLDHDPEVILLVVLRDFFHGVFLLGDGELLGARGLGGLLSGRGVVDRRGAGGHTTTTAVTASTVPFNRDLTRGRGVDVERDLAQTVLGRRCAAGNQLPEQVLAGAITSDTAVNHTAQQGRTTQTVGTVDTTSQLTAGVETLERLVVSVEDLRVLVDLNTTHGEVQDGLHQGDVELVVDVEGQVVEETLAPGVLLLAFRNSVVVAESLLELLRTAANLLGQLLASHLPHQATASVVTGVEVQDVGGLAVEDETDRPLVLLLLLPHLGRDVVTVTQLIGETLTVAVEQETTLTTQGLRGQELELGLRVLGVDETGRVDLDLVHIDAVGADFHQHLLAVTGGVGTVGTRQTKRIGTVVLEKGLVAKVGSVTTGGEDHNTINGRALAVRFVGDAANEVPFLVHVGDAGPLHDLNAVGLAFAELLQPLHQGVGDGHSGELGIVAPMRPGLRVTTAMVSDCTVSMRCGWGGWRQPNLPETRNQGEVEVEDILQPLDGGRGLVGENLDELGTGLVSGGFESVVVESLDAVGNTEVGLGARQGAVNPGSGLGRVATKESYPRQYAF